MCSLDSLMQQAWHIRRRFEPIMYFFAPGAKHYDNRFYLNHALSFINVSVTGTACACKCDHCNGRLLETMKGAPTPETLRHIVDQALQKGTEGILVSGGADSTGQVLLLPFIETIRYAKKMGLTVLVHGGLIQPETAAGLKEAGVDQVLLDVIGDEKTIQQVYHLDRTPQDYLQSMLYCCEAGLSIAPHVVVGLHYGHIRGEVQALEMIQQVGPETLVLVILTPNPGTAMARVQAPSAAEAAAVMAKARIMHPRTPITLGCARPVGAYKRQVEIKAVECGVNGIAYPDQATVLYARSRGMKTQFSEECCSLVGKKIAAVMKTG